MGHRRAIAGETRCLSRSRPERRRHLHRCNGRGHRPCHGAPSLLARPGAKSPRPAPAPLPAGAGLCFSRTCWSTGDRPTRVGKRGSRFLVPPPGGSSVPGSARRSRLSMRPECPCRTRLMCPKDAKAKVRRDPGRGRLPQGARPQAKGVCTGAEGEIGGQIREEGGGSLPCARPKPAGRLRGPNPVRPLRRPDASFPRPFPARRERSRTGT
jgi:hypothetical protein